MIGAYNSMDNTSLDINFDAFFTQIASVFVLISMKRMILNENSMKLVDFIHNSTFKTKNVKLPKFFPCSYWVVS